MYLHTYIRTQAEQSELHLRTAWAAAAQNGGQPFRYARERVSKDARGVCMCAVCV